MRGVRILAGTLLVAALVFGLAPASAGQAWLNMLICRDVRISDLGASGTQVAPVGCGREFAASSPYVILYVELANVDQSFTLTWELLDPADEVYSRFRINRTVTSGRWTFFFWNVLPVSSTERDIVDANARFKGRVVEVGATPVSQKMGQWKLRVTVFPGPSSTYRFSLVP